MEALEVRTMAKVSRRLIPFVIICYFVAYLDRVNLSFAALEMNKDLGFTSTVYGIGAGAFFITMCSQHHDRKQPGVLLRPQCP